MKNFWEQLPKPFLALAPLEDVTDAAFRRLIATYGKPDVMFTEFTSADGLVRADESGKRKLMKKLSYSDIERPIVAQLFSATPEYMEQGARLCQELGFAGVDINMGCPVSQVEKQGCGAALIKNPALARELIRAAKRGACACASLTCTSASCIPVSVKTRIGYNTDELETWLPELLAEEPAVVTIHARTRKEMSDVPARWEHVAHAVRIRDSMRVPTLIMGNGDVRDIEDACAKAAATKCDGVMLGRAIFGNPWLFSIGGDRTPDERMQALIEHLDLFDSLLAGIANYALMKKHFKAYVSGWDQAKGIRVQLMETERAADARAILSQHSS